MGKLFKIDLGEEDELFLGYHQKKLYQHFRTCCKNKLKQLQKYEKKLKRKYFENNTQTKQSSPNSHNQNSTILSNELDNQLNYFYELNKYAFNLLNYDGTSAETNNESKTDNDNGITNMSIDNNTMDCNNFNFNDYKCVLSDIAYNDNTRNYKIFKKIFTDQQRNKKQDSTHSNTNTNTANPTANANTVPTVNSTLMIDGCDIYCCIRCGMHLTKKSLVMDQNFHGRTGPSFLIQSVFNIDIGPKATRKLHTGMHVVSDVFCKRCSTNVGWYYHEASKLEQQYKISHYVLECSLICNFNQYMLHNYYNPNALLPSLDFNNGNGSGNNHGNNEQSRNAENDSDDSMDDLTDRNDNQSNDNNRNRNRSLPVLPSYMSYNHHTYQRNGDKRYRKHSKRKRIKTEEISITESESETKEHKSERKHRYNQRRKHRRHRIKNEQILTANESLITSQMVSIDSQRNNDSNKTLSEGSDDMYDSEDNEDEEEEESEEESEEEEEDNEDNEDSTESEQIGSATDTESDSQSDNETAESMEDETEEVDVD